MYGTARTKKSKLLSTSDCTFKTAQSNSQEQTAQQRRRCNVTIRVSTEESVPPVEAPPKGIHEYAVLTNPLFSALKSPSNYPPAHCAITSIMSFHQSYYDHDQPPAGVPPRCKIATCFRSSTKKSLPLAIVFAVGNEQLTSNQHGRCRGCTFRAPRSTRSLVVRVFPGGFVKRCFRFCEDID